MSLPSIEIKNNLTKVIVNNTTLWFSYTTLIAFRVGNRKVVHINEWNNTTGKHLNQIDGGDISTRVDSETFLEKWSELTNIFDLTL